MKVAAETFAITPRLGSQGCTLKAGGVERVFSPLLTTVLLLESHGQRLCLISSHFVTHYYRITNLLRRTVAAQLGLPVAQVLSFSSHNHCSVQLLKQGSANGAWEYDLQFKTEDLEPEGVELVQTAARVAARLPDRLEDAELRRGLGHERRISYNRKGHRADGTTYLMREEDRLTQGADFCGDIDDDAAVLGFFGKDGRARAILAHFTAHPVTAFHPEHPIVFGEFPQVASELLSQAFGGAPVVFLQGCAGDVNAKGLLSGKPAEQSVADATYFGQCLAQTWIDALIRAQPVTADALTCTLQLVDLPFAGLPPRADLDFQITDMEAFVARCAAHDPNTQSCQGLNFPRTMSPAYRGELVKPLLRWAHWARAFHTSGQPSQAPQKTQVELAAVRLGDVGLVGFSCEPFQAIGRQIKQASPLSLTLPCAYMHDTCLGYVPDAGNLGGREYMSSFYRYTTTLLPFAPPAGDRLAHAAVAMLRQMTDPVQTH